MEIADTESERAIWLMYRDSLQDNIGMWFEFDSVSEQTFWMKNVKFPIDILFIDEDLKIHHIWKSAQPCSQEPCPRYRSLGKVKFALEIIGGFCKKYGIEPGEHVIFSR